MYVIVIYDADVKRVSKYHKLLKQYLFPVQNSAFEGIITQSNLCEMKKALTSINDKGLDSIIIYRISNIKFLKREVIGQTKEKDVFII
ncbi:MAG: CRISPR-associated endonuclease Cas2 [bacterium]